MLLNLAVAARRRGREGPLTTECVLISASYLLSNNFSGGISRSADGSILRSYDLQCILHLNKYLQPPTNLIQVVVFFRVKYLADVIHIAFLLRALVGVVYIFSSTTAIAHPEEGTCKKKKPVFHKSEILNYIRKLLQHLHSLLTLQSPLPIRPLPTR